MQTHFYQELQKEVTMQSVLFQNPNAIFDFELLDAIERLKHYSEEGVHEANEILEAISSSPLSTINVRSDYFAFIALDLIEAEKGHTYCKICRATYDTSQLISIPLGFGKSPFSVNIKPQGGIIKRLFGKTQLMCGSGGTAYHCPKGHELISAITWMGTLRIPQVKDLSCL